MEEWEKVPTDLSINLAPYLYGSPKKGMSRAVFVDTSYWIALLNRSL